MMIMLSGSFFRFSTVILSRYPDSFSPGMGGTPGLAPVAMQILGAPMVSSPTWIR